jgi:Uncharacterized small protein
MAIERRCLRARLAQALRTALGAPDYGAYLEHMRSHHPEQTPLDAKAFFRERQRARYRRGAQRCC